MSAQDPEIITGAVVSALCWAVAIGLIVVAIFMDGCHG